MTDDTPAPGTNEQKIIRASRFVSSIFGTVPPAILVDGDGKVLTVYSNRPLKGFAASNGAYVRRLEGLDEKDIRRLGTDARFFDPYNYYNGEREPRNDSRMEVELGLKAVGYAKVPSRDLWFRLEGYIPELDFPEEMVLAHEMTHGIGIEDERIPVFVERTYLSEFYPEDVARWDKSRSTAKTDPDHMDAFRAATTPEGRKVLKKELEEFLCQ